MEKPDRRRDVVYRGLRRGSAVGALTGGLSLTCGPLLTGHWGDVPTCFALGLVSGPVGAVAGLLIALGPAVVLACKKDYFLRRPIAARLCVVSVLLTLTVAFTVAIVRTAVVNGHADVWNFVDLVAYILTPLCGGMALAAASTDYVLTGKRWERGGSADPVAAEGIFAMPV